MTSNVTTRWTVSPNWQRPFLCLSTIPQGRPAYPWGGLRLGPPRENGLPPRARIRCIGASIGQPGSLYGRCAGTNGSSGCGVMCDGRVAPPLGKKPKSSAPYVLSGIEAPAHTTCAL